MRLNRYLALAGVASRRGAEEFIRNGRVTVNGQVVSDLATRISPADRVKVDGRSVRQRAFRYILLNKPKGYLTTASDGRARKTVYDLLPPDLPKLAHVGRLDLESEGLLLLTNDGELALRLTHPRYKLEKEYLVSLDREFDAADLPTVRKGIYLAEGRARFDELHKISSAEVRVVLTQGIKRQIRRVLAALGYRVRRLQRIRIGPIRIQGLNPGEFRELAEDELAALQPSTPGGTPRPRVGLQRQPARGTGRAPRIRRPGDAARVAQQRRRRRLAPG
ncbi:MAG: rRNA pseudouridine synthase [Verrucomicrobia bacterium]|nr:rRNA pseudouridine synthase [Verrucomicrobiota bacterium]